MLRLVSTSFISVGVGCKIPNTSLYMSFIQIRYKTQYSNTSLKQFKEKNREDLLQDLLHKTAGEPHELSTERFFFFSTFASTRDINVRHILAAGWSSMKSYWHMVGQSLVKFLAGILCVIQ